MICSGDKAQLKLIKKATVEDKTDACSHCPQLSVFTADIVIELQNFQHLFTYMSLRYINSTLAISWNQ